MENVKKSDPELFPALAMCLILDALLGKRAAFSTRLGLLTALPAVLTLWGVGAAFAAIWRKKQPPAWLRVLFAVMLLLSAAGELLRIGDLYEIAGLGQEAALLVILVPLAAVYLRRPPVIANMAAVWVIFLVGGFAVTAASVAQRLHLENLQMEAASLPALGAAYGAQALTLRPEFLLAAFVTTKRSVPAAGKLAFTAVFSGIGVNLLLELFFGAALLKQDTPLHALACNGAFSVFERLEWVQVLLWTIGAAVRIALYLYAFVHLLEPQKPTETVLTLPRYTTAALITLILCLIWRQTPRLPELRSIINIWCWALLGAVGMGGVWLWLKRKRASHG